ncbi:MAG: SCO family protein [Gammaproteobacteria bacterium]|nr:SCO family protein [Gammaproteobacteria bacterium]MDH5799957.1 SCO family protein [Gammaproteobacteria bacterium]
MTQTRIYTSALLLVLSVVPTLSAHEGEKHQAAPAAPISEFSAQSLQEANRIQVQKVIPPAAEVERARSYFTDMTLTTHTGERVKFYSDMLHGKVVLLNVMYTRCKDACPLVTQHLSKVKAQLGPLFGKEVFFVSISNDPGRDTPEALQQFAKKHQADHPGWTFLTGNAEMVKQVVSKFGLYPDDIEAHNPLLLAGNTRTRHWSKIIPNTPVPTIAMKLRNLLREG